MKEKNYISELNFISQFKINLRNVLKRPLKFNIEKVKYKKFIAILLSQSQVDRTNF